MYLHEHSICSTHVYSCFVSGNLLKVLWCLPAYVHVVLMPQVGWEEVDYIHCDAPTWWH